MPRFFSFHFTLRDERGRVLDTSCGGAPAEFVEGAGQIVEGLEAVLVALGVGERRAVAVPPAQGYGLVDPTLRQSVARAAVPVAELRVGEQFRTGPDRHAPVVTVVALDGARVWLDANHPLAGRVLHFEVELVAVRPATAAEDLASREAGLT